MTCQPGGIAACVGLKKTAELMVFTESVNGKWSLYNRSKCFLHSPIASHSHTGGRGYSTHLLNKDFYPFTRIRTMMPQHLGQFGAQYLALGYFSVKAAQGWD